MTPPLPLESPAQVIRWHVAPDVAARAREVLGPDVEIQVHADRPPQWWAVEYVEAERQ